MTEIFGLKYLKTAESLEDTVRWSSFLTGQIEVVEKLKYIGSLKSADANCNNYNDIKSLIGMAKKGMLDMVPIWRDRGINKELVRTVLIQTFYGAQG